jgi:hypothetical protein
LVSDRQLIHDRLACGRPQRANVPVTNPDRHHGFSAADAAAPPPVPWCSCLFEDGVQKPALLAHVVPVEDADLTTAGDRLLSVPAVAAVEITPGEGTS